MPPDETASKSPIALESPQVLQPMLPALVNRGHTCFDGQNAANLPIEQPFLLPDYKNLRTQSVYPYSTPPQMLPCPVQLQQINPMHPEDHCLRGQQYLCRRLCASTISLEVELLLEQGSHPLRVSAPVQGHTGVKLFDRA